MKRIPNLISEFSRHDSWPKSWCLAPKLKKETLIRLRKKLILPLIPHTKISAFSVFEEPDKFWRVEKGFAVLL